MLAGFSAVGFYAAVALARRRFIVREARKGGIPGAKLCVTPLDDLRDKIGSHGLGALVGVSCWW